MKIVEEPISEYNIEVIDVTSAEYLGDFILRISFSNNTRQIVNFKPFLASSLHPSVRKYLDEKRFKDYTIVDGNLIWNEYEMIFPVADLLEGRIS